MMLLARCPIKKRTARCVVYARPSELAGYWLPPSAAETRLFLTRRFFEKDVSCEVYGYGSYLLFSARSRGLARRAAIPMTAARTFCIVACPVPGRAPRSTQRL